MGSGMRFWRDSRSKSGVRLTWPQRALSWPMRFILGPDAVISYSRGDASLYALKLAIVLTENRVSCYVVQWGDQPDRSLSTMVRTALPRSSMPVLFFSPAAAKSRPTRNEIGLFLLRRCRYTL